MRRALSTFSWIILLALSGRAVIAAPATMVVVEMTEFRFRPSVIHLQMGRPVTLRLVNRGQIAHQIETGAFRHLPITIVNEASYLEAPGVEILRLQPGATATLHFTPRVRGRVPFACTIEGHREAGMTGVLDIR